MRLGIAYEYGPYFSRSIARVDPPPRQLEAVYDHFLRLPRIRFLLADDPGAGNPRTNISEIIHAVIISEQGGKEKSPRAKPSCYPFRSRFACPRGRRAHELGMNRKAACSRARRTGANSAPHGTKPSRHRKVRAARPLDSGLMIKCEDRSGTRDAIRGVRLELTHSHRARVRWLTPPPPGPPSPLVRIFESSGRRLVTGTVAATGDFRLVARPPQ